MIPEHRLKRNHWKPRRHYPFRTLKSRLVNLSPKTHQKLIEGRAAPLHSDRHTLWPNRDRVFTPTEFSD